MAGEDRFSGAIQESLLTAMAYAGQEAAPILAVLTPEHFDGYYQDIASRIIDYRTRFREPPAPGHLDDIFDHVLSDPDHKQYRAYSRILVGMREQAPSLNVQYLVDRVVRFARSQRLKQGLIEAGERYSQGGDTRDDEVENILQRTLRDRIETADYGERLSDNPLDFLGRDEFEDGQQIRTGIDLLDRRGLVPTRGELYYLMGRKKAGKCISGDELVLLGDGRRKRIADVVRDKDPEILAMAPNGQLVLAKISEWWDNGVKPLVRVTTVTGRSISTTPNHQYFTPDGWRDLSELKVGDTIATPLNLDRIGVQRNISTSAVRLLGYLIADGGMTKTTSTTFTKLDRRIKRDFVECVEAFGDAVTEISDLDCYIISSEGNSRSKVRAWLNDLGLNGKKSRDKFVPEAIFQMEDALVAQFLQTLISCDGSIYKSNKEIEFSVSSKRLARDVQHLLLRLGIISRYSEFSARFNGQSIDGYAKIVVRGKENILKFLDVVGWFREGSEERVAEVRKFFEARKANRMHDCYKHSSDIMFEKIIQIEELPPGQTFDISVPKYHNFVAADIVVHNSWWLHHLGKRAARQYWNVAHISLENRTPRVKQRYVQSWLSVAKRSEKYLLAEFHKDKNDKLDDIDYEVMSPRFSFDNPKHRKDIEHLARRWAPSLGRILIKEWPSGVLSIPMLERWLDGLEASENFIPDMILLDYPQLMKLDPRDLRGSYGRIAVELRRIAGERNLAMCAVMQSNRQGEQAKLLQSHHVAEDISQIATADTIITYNRTEAERRLGLARLHVAGGRNDKDGFTVLISQSYDVGQFSLDSVPMAGSSYWEMLKEIDEAAARESISGERDAGVYDDDAAPEAADD